MSVKEVLLNTLEDLGDDEYKKFKFFLRDRGIPKSQLEQAARVDTVDLIIQTCNQQSTEVVKKILEQINRNDLVEELLSSSSKGAQGLEWFDQSKTSSEDVSLSPPVVKTPTDALRANTSCKYDKITCKHLIQSGSPTVYQLTPKKGNIGTLRKMTLGKKDPNKTNRTILLVGETGTGKSTLINALVNYDMGVMWEDEVWFEIVEEDKKRSQCDGQKSDVVVYEIFGFEGKTLPYSLTIIDTPGYGDTRGTDRDDIISQRVFDLFRSEEGVHEINAVGLVLKASDNRLSDRMRYIFDSVVSLFGKDLENNIVSLLTHSDGLTPESVLQALQAANIKCAIDEKNQPVHFLFDNCKNTERTKETKVAWEITMTGMSEFTDFLEMSGPQDLKTTVDVLKSRLRLTSCIQELQDGVESTELKRKKKEIQESLKKAEEEMKSNENFTVEVEEVDNKKEELNGGMWALALFDGAVCCNVCKQTCHCPCTMAWYPSGCNVMKGGRCTVCIKKCPVSDHVKGNWKYVSTTSKVQKTFKDVKEKYEKGKADRDSLSKDLKHTEKLQRDKDELLEESFQHVVKLEQIALNVDSLSTHVHLDFLIDKMNENGDTEKVQKLKEMKSGVDEGTRAGLRYKRTAAGKAVREKTN